MESSPTLGDGWGMIHEFHACVMPGGVSARVLDENRVNGRKVKVIGSQAPVSGELASEALGPENSPQMSDSSGANPMSDAQSGTVPTNVGTTAAEGPHLRLAGTNAGPVTPKIQRLLDLRSELVSAKAVILEDAGFIRGRLQRSGRVDAISSITGEDAFEGAATRIDHEISRLDLELARLDERAVRIETVPQAVGRLRGDS